MKFSPEMRTRNSGNLLEINAKSLLIVYAYRASSISRLRALLLLLLCVYTQNTSNSTIDRLPKAF